MRIAAAFIALLLSGCPAERPMPAPSCAPWVEAPTAVVTEVGTTRRVVARFFNPTDRPLAVRALELTGDDAFRLPTKATLAQVPSGACDGPAVFELDVDFAPTSLAEQSAILTGELGLEPFAIKLVGQGRDRGSTFFRRSPSEPSPLGSRRAAMSRCATVERWAPRSR